MIQASEGDVRQTTKPQGTEDQRATEILLAGKRFVTDFEIEAAYGIPRKTLQNMRVLGRGPAFRKFGSAVRYDVRSLELWIESLPSGGAGIPSSALKGAAPING
jgi:hypothetical protein